MRKSNTTLSDRNWMKTVCSAKRIHKRKRGENMKFFVVFLFHVACCLLSVWSRLCNNRSSFLFRPPFESETNNKQILKSGNISVVSDIPLCEKQKCSNSFFWWFLNRKIGWEACTQWTACMSSSLVSLQQPNSRSSSTFCYIKKKMKSDSFVCLGCSRSTRALSLINWIFEGTFERGNNFIYLEPNSYHYYYYYSSINFIGEYLFPFSVGPSLFLSLLRVIPSRTIQQLWMHWNVCACAEWNVCLCTCIRVMSAPSPFSHSSPSFSSFLRFSSPLLASLSLLARRRCSSSVKWLLCTFVFMWMASCTLCCGTKRWDYSSQWLRKVRTSKKDENKQIKYSENVIAS